MPINTAISPDATHFKSCVREISVEPVGFILEEGLPLLDLQTIVCSMAKAAAQAGVLIVAGDTKVVEAGKGDGIFINTTGIGVVAPAHILKPEFAAGDKIILSGSIADHGMAIMSLRNGMDFTTDIKSDCAALNGLIQNILPHAAEIRCMRDPTRGGVSATLNEWASQYNLGLNIDEAKILVHDNVKGLCELLGLDPLHVANEGKVLVISSAAKAEAIVSQMRTHPLGRDAQIIGEIQHIDDKYVTMTTVFGGVRRVEWLNGEQLPRIC